ncbi:MAG: drug:proton antiporter, partial [Alphaproteobacteria bacterium HGW-Alphaproteobacteria-6]
MPVAIRIARREMRGGWRGFAVLLACLILGVAAIAAVGTVRAAISTALKEQGAVLLGGDAQMSFTYRYASEAERAFMAERALRLSEIVDFRSMAVVGEAAAAERALTQVKAVDEAYPLTGTLLLDPPMAPAAAFAAGADALPGAVMEPVLADRLGLAIGDVFALGSARFRLTARILREPDSAAGGFTLGPRTILRTADLAGSGLLEPGSLFDTRYRLMLPVGADLARHAREAMAQFRDNGLRWQDARRGAPGAERFVERMGSFLVLIGLAGLAVGGIGIAAAVRSYLDSRIATLAALKAMGAESGTIFAAYLAQIGALALLGIGAGLIAGTALPVLAGPLIASWLPIPVSIAPALRPLGEAALYGVLTAALFALWPLARTREVKAAALFRDLGPGRRAWPGWRLGAALAAIAALLVASVTGLSEVRRLALGTIAGVVAALLVLMLAAAVLRRLARLAARHARGRPGFRLALAAIGGPREEATAVILSLGLGLSVLAVVGQVEANLRQAIDRDLP